MTIKRQPQMPLFRIMQGSAELMRFRAKTNGAAKVIARRHTMNSPPPDSPPDQLLERFCGHWVVIGVFHQEGDWRLLHGTDVSYRSR